MQSNVSSKDENTALKKWNILFLQPVELKSKIDYTNTLFLHTSANYVRSSCHFFIGLILVLNEVEIVYDIKYYTTYPTAISTLIVNLVF